MTLVTFSIRIPVEFREKLDARAAANCRKRNGEITAILKAALSQDQKKDQTT